MIPVDYPIYVLAGVNGSGKSSIGGAAIESHGLIYYNPDEVAKQLKAVNTTRFLMTAHLFQPRVIV